MTANRFYSDGEACRLAGVDWPRFISFCREAGFGCIVDRRTGGGCTYIVPEEIVREIVRERDKCVDAVLARIVERETSHAATA